MGCQFPGCVCRADPAGQGGGVGVAHAQSDHAGEGVQLQVAPAGVLPWRFALRGGAAAIVAAAAVGGG